MFTIPRDDFIAAVTQARGATARSGMPILECVLVSADKGKHVTISGTDMQISYEETIKSVPDRKDRVCVTAAHLHGLLRTLPASDVICTVLDNHWLQIQSGRSTFKLMGLSPADWPAQDVATPGEAVAVKSADLSDLINRVAYSVSQDEARVNLSGALMIKDGGFRMVSTDGHRLTTAATTGIDLGLPAKGIIVHRRGIAEIQKMLGRFDEVSVSTTKDHIIVAAGPARIAVKLSNVTFPPYQAVIPATSKRWTKVHRRDLIDALQRAVVMAPEKTCAVKITLDGAAMRLEADNPDRGTASQTIDVETTGGGDEAWTAGFNARYLLESASSMACEYVRIGSTGPLEPIVMVDDAEATKAVVMPMRI